MVLPDEPLRRVDRLKRPGGWSRFINEAVAVRQFIATRSTEVLRRQFEFAVVRDRDLDREVSADWFAADLQTDRE